MANDLSKAVQEKIDAGLPVKLHLGCGPNVWDNWINVEGPYAVDLDERIVLHDLESGLDIPDNCVDEIFTSHVIEHIMPNEVPSMLKEWLRVLKPGGFVATEWPDLLKCCTNIVNDPSLIYTEDSKLEKRAVAGIFGRIGKYQDPAMLHKWGYSEESMIRLKKSVGFSRTEAQEPHHPKTKKNSIDSRVVGYK